MKQISFFQLIMNHSSVLKYKNEAVIQNRLKNKAPENGKKKKVF